MQVFDGNFISFASARAMKMTPPFYPPIFESTSFTLDSIYLHTTFLDSNNVSALSRIRSIFEIPVH